MLVFLYMKLLGIDYGTKRLGVAVSDDGGTLAFPQGILPNDKEIFNKLKQIVVDEKAEGFVVGESTNKAGVANKVEQDIQSFVQKLEEVFGLPVKKQKEFFTSVESRRGFAKPAKSRKPKDTSKKVDASAAALILQRYLDTMNS